MAVQPIISKPGVTSQRPPIQITQAIPLWVPLMMVFVTALSVVALVFSILKAPANVVDVRPSAVEVPNADTAPVDDGKEVQVKLVELEKNLSLARTEIQRLNEELLQVRSAIDGVNANVTIVQSQTSKFVPPVNIAPNQPEFNKN